MLGTPIDRWKVRAFLHYIDADLRNTAERAPYEMGYSLLRTAQNELAAARQELDSSLPTRASRWVTKWGGLTHRLR